LPAMRRFLKMAKLWKDIIISSSTLQSPLPLHPKEKIIPSTYGIICADEYDI
jgi:hypothetical protein